MSKTTEFPDMLNCFIKKCFKVGWFVPPEMCGFVGKTVVPDAGKNDGNIVYLFE